MIKQHNPSQSLVAVTSVVIIFLAFLGMLLLYMTYGLEREWNQFQQETQQRSQSLSELHRAIGYGGLIHNFKNYVLRGGEARKQQLADDFIATKIRLGNYRQIVTSQRSREALQVIASTIDEYQLRFDEISSGHSRALTAEQIDQLVKVDDGPALQALTELEKDTASFVSNFQQKLDRRFEQIINLMLAGAVIVPLVLLVAYRYQGILSRMMRLTREKQQVEQALSVAQQQAANARSASETYRHMAYHCSLTEIPNRKMFMERAEAVLIRARAQRTHFAILFVDVDDFKQINDGFGHQVGDEVLIEVAARLQNSVRDGDLVARLGGDEFALLINSVSEYEIYAQLSQRMASALFQPFDQIHPDLDVSCSVGGVLYPEDGDSIKSLMDKADSTMYQVKRDGKGDLRFNSVSMDINIAD